MFADFPELLWCIIPGATIGYVVGLLMTHYYPKETQERSEQNRRLPWWAFGLFALMFAGLATFSACEGRWSFALFFILFGLLQIAAAVVNHLSPTAENMASIESES